MSDDIYDEENIDDYDEGYEEYQIDNENEYQDINTDKTVEYEMLKPDEFRKKREEQIAEFMEFSYLPRDEAIIVLINYEWNFEKLTSVWYENVESNKIKCGIEISPEAEKEIKKFYKENDIPDKTCLVCFCEAEGEDLISLKCKHGLCKDCYTEYLLSRLEDPLTLIATPTM